MNSKKVVEFQFLLVSIWNEQLGWFRSKTNAQIPRNKDENICRLRRTEFCRVRVERKRLKGEPEVFQLIT